jgi:UPF0755 protein
LIRALLGVLIFLFLVAVAAAAYGWVRAQEFLGTAAEIPGGEVVLEVPRGASYRQAAEILSRNGVVGSEWKFYYYTRYMIRYEHMEDFKSGEYLFKSGMKPREVALKLFKGEVMTHKVTIPEGLRYEEIADILAAERLVERAEFLKMCTDGEFARTIGIPAETVEGYLYPDTYMFSRGLSSEHVIRAMVKRFREEWSKVEPAITARGMTMHQAVTLASIIEKETGARTERPLIAAVFFNRLRRGMKLQMDPTVIYGIIRTKGSFSGNLRRSDLETPTDYNTYTNEGLPKGPICNTGSGALQAVARPADTKVLYFVSRNDGTHVFCPDYKCHKEAVDRWQVEYFGKGKER